MPWYELLVDQVPRSSLRLANVSCSLSGAFSAVTGSRGVVRVLETVSMGAASGQCVSTVNIVVYRGHVGLWKGHGCHFHASLGPRRAGARTHRESRRVETVYAAFSAFPRGHRASCRRHIRTFQRPEDHVGDDGNVDPVFGAYSAKGRDA